MIQHSLTLLYDKKFQASNISRVITFNLTIVRNYNQTRISKKDGKYFIHEKTMQYTRSPLIFNYSLA